MHIAEEPNVCHLIAQASQLSAKARKKALFFVKSSKTALDKGDFADSVRTSDTMPRPKSSDPCACMSISYSYSGNVLSSGQHHDLSLNPCQYEYLETVLPVAHLSVRQAVRTKAKVQPVRVQLSCMTCVAACQTHHMTAPSWDAGCVGGAGELTPGVPEHSEL